MTRADALARGLLRMGTVEVLPSPSRKYRCFRGPVGDTYWLGKCGALRRGRTVTGAVPYTTFRGRAEKARIEGMGRKDGA